jgi:hypothetical protein
MPAPSIRSASTYTPSVAASSQVVPAPAGVVDGDLLIMFGIWPANGPFTTLAFPTGFTQLWNTQVSATQAFTTGCAWKIASSEPSSYTLSYGGAGDRSSVTIIAIQGAAGNTPHKASNTTNATAGTSFATPSVTPTVANCLILALMGTYVGGNGTVSWTPDAAFTEYEDFANTNNKSGCEAEYKTQTIAAAVSATASCNSSAGRSAGILAIAPPSTSSAIKTVDGLAKANIKTRNGLAIASVKTINGLA